MWRFCILLMVLAAWPQLLLWAVGAGAVAVVSYRLWLLQPEDRRRLW